MSATLRTFIAVEVSGDVRARAQRLIRDLTPLSPDVNWVVPQNLHLTLNFLGETDLLEVPQLCELMTSAVSPLPPFDLQVMGAGAFPSLDRPRTIWLGMGEGSEELVQLQQCISKGLVKLGFRCEQRPFRPHLTIGRVKGQSIRGLSELAAELAAQRDYNGGACDVSEVVLFSSEISRRGPTYESLCVAPLDGF